MCPLLYKYQPEYPPSSNPPSSQQPSSKIPKHIISSANKAFTSVSLSGPHSLTIPCICKTDIRIQPTIPLKMQLTTVFAILTAGVSVASAWSFKGWDGAGYTGSLLISSTGGLVDNLCIDITLGNNQMSSFQWNHGVDNPCLFRLYDFASCSGPPLATSVATWNNPSMANPINNKAASLRVDCFF